MSLATRLGREEERDKTDKVNTFVGDQLSFGTLVLEVGSVTSHALFQKHFRNNPLLKSIPKCCHIVTVSPLLFHTCTQLVHSFPASLRGLYAVACSTIATLLGRAYCAKHGGQPQAIVFDC